MSKTIQLIISAFLIVSLIALFVTFKPVSINGPGMEPMYKNGATLLSNKLAYLSSTPQRGDVVTFKYTESPNYSGIARIIALPTDRLKIQNGKVFINDTELQENYLPANTKTLTAPRSGIQDETESAGKIVDTGEAKLIDEAQEIIIPNSNYFVMGDNRENSIDSRSLGFIDIKDIFGKISFEYKLPF